MRNNWRSRVLAALAPEHSGPTSDFTFNPEIRAHVPHFRPAAVLVGIVERHTGPHVLLTVRTEHLPSHKGQVAFPGGKMDAGETAEQAALREAREEVALDPANVEVVGRLDFYESGSGFCIDPVVAFLDPGFTVTANPGEVADVFETPLAYLMDFANHRKQGTVWNGHTRYYWEMPWQTYRIWGVTAGVIRNMAERLARAEGRAIVEPPR